MIGFFKGPRTKAPPKVRKLITTYGQQKVLFMNVCRKPISKMLDTAMNVMSLGKWEEQKKELGYDSLFHLYIVIGLENNMILTMEKNQVVNIAPHQSDLDVNCMRIDIPKVVTLAELLVKGEQLQGPSFYLYNPKNNNCQYFVMSVLKGSNLGNQEVFDFVLQDSEKLVSGALDFIGRHTTDLAARFDVLLNGEGLII